VSCCLCQSAFCSGQKANLLYCRVGRYLTRIGISSTLECTESKWCCTWIVNRLQQKVWNYTDLFMLMETSRFPNSLEVVVLCLYVTVFIAYFTYKVGEQKIPPAVSYMFRTSELSIVNVHNFVLHFNIVYFHVTNMYIKMHHICICNAVKTSGS
jgi:hypothetical protein